jgi:hypothetical protein
MQERRKPSGQVVLERRKYSNMLTSDVRIYHEAGKNGAIN